MSWDDLRFFLAVARTGSIRAASAALSVNPSTVARRIDAFEKKLSVRLFERLPSGYTLTPAGEEMVGSAERIEDEVANLDRQVIGRDTQLNGVLRVTMTAAFATHLLMPDMAEFAKQYPGIELEFAVSNEEFNLTKREADVAIRITPNPPDHLIGRQICKIATAVYASEDYLRTHDPVNQPSDMSWLGWEDNERYPPWIKSSAFPKTATFHQANDIFVQLEAAKSGLGLTLLPCFLADQFSTLKRLSIASYKPCGDIWILTHKDLKNTARVRTFTTFMAKAFDKHLDALQGKITPAKANKEYHKEVVLLKARV